MHRAVFLASRLKDPKGRILVTTFTTNLSVTIKGLIQKLVEQKCPEAAGKIKVTNLHALARTICTRGGRRGKVTGSEIMAEIWSDVLAANPGITYYDGVRRGFRARGLRGSDGSDGDFVRG